jgi:hypothetical protein
MSDVPVSSQTWLQNFRPYVNGVRVKWPDLLLNIAAGESVELLLEFEYSYLIGDPESPLRLCSVPAAEEVGLVCDPPFGQLVEMAQGLISLTWIITATQTASGPFELHFEMPLYPGMPNSPLIPGAVLDFTRELDVTFDALAVGFAPDYHGYPCHGAAHTVTVKPRPDSRLLDKDIHLVTDAALAGVIVTPAPPTVQRLTAEGITWQLDCRATTEDKSFALQLAVMESGVTSLPLAMSLGHNLVTAYRWTQAQSGHGDWYSHNIRATSVFLNKPAPGVPVTVSVSGGGTSSGITNYLGEYSRASMDNWGITLTLTNRYDGSVV